MAVVHTSRTSRGASSHARALWLLLTTLIDELPQLPTPKRVALRNARAALERAHKELLQLTDSDVAQILAEEDGEAHEDIP